jgi:hypothetical protein
MVNCESSSGTVQLAIFGSSKLGVGDGLIRKQGQDGPNVSVCAEVQPAGTLL